MRDKPLIRRIFAILADRAPAAEPRPGEPATTADDLRSIRASVKMISGAKVQLFFWTASVAVVIVSLVVAVAIVKIASVLRPTFSSPSEAMATHSIALVSPVPSSSTMPAPSSARLAKKVQPPHWRPTPSAKLVLLPTGQPLLASEAAAPNLLDSVDGALSNAEQSVQGATTTLLQLVSAEERGAVDTWCSLATTLNVSVCEQDLSQKWGVGRTQSSPLGVASAGILVGQPIERSGQYVYPIDFGGNSLSVAMVWDGWQWRLSSGDYQRALSRGGILTPLVGNVESLLSGLLK